ncbi:hypothetical protein BBK82_43030 [Lentzea guizhouensis]|uniref:Uncharacterized protein n=1 Tax=Lentzea guizhouensis TaxID=1586287 RepID=A0A1B2HVL8_9PSEU|nr:hypothetical protein BBK82_43030 [Lentzea guizhouensis]
MSGRGSLASAVDFGGRLDVPARLDVLARLDVRVGLGAPARPDNSARLAVRVRFGVPARLDVRRACSSSASRGGAVRATGTRPGLTGGTARCSAASRASSSSASRRATASGRSSPSTARCASCRSLSLNDAGQNGHTTAACSRGLPTLPATRYSPCSSPAHCGHRRSIGWGESCQPGSA